MRHWSAKRGPWARVDDVGNDAGMAHGAVGKSVDKKKRKPRGRTLYARSLVVSIPPSCSIVFFCLVVLVFAVFRKELVVVSESGGEATRSQLIRHTRHTRVTGTGFSGVRKCQPVPVPVPARDLNPCGFANP